MSGAAKNLRLSLLSPAITCRGKEAESIVQGIWESAGTWRGLFEPGTAAHSKKRERSP